MRRLQFILFGAVISAALIVSGCQAVFTYSPVSFLQRDVSEMSAAQQAEYAEDALASGDKEKMKEALTAIEQQIADDPENSEDLMQLVVDLAIEGSGVTDALTDITELQGASDLTEEEQLQQVEDILGSIDTQTIDSAITQINNLEAAGADVSETQYIMAAVGVVAQMQETAGSIEDLMSPESLDAETQEDLTEQGNTLNDLYTGLSEASGDDSSGLSDQLMSALESYTGTTESTS
ncbi:MAG: hypothetical protein ACLFR1_12740 [Spirochaetia bacterium]